mgnify:FL=1
MISYRKKACKILAIGLCLPLLMQARAGAETRFSDPYSRSAIVSDMDTNRIVYEKNASQVVPMASLTKMMTLLLTFDAIAQKKVDYKDIVTILPSDVNRVGTNIKLNAGDQISLEELMKGMMIVSANDAALAISHHVGTTYGQFVENMNNKAKEIGMENTVFYNPNGLPTSINVGGNVVGVENKTTARDILVLSKYLYSTYGNQLTAITNMSSYVNPSKAINEENTNPLLPLIANVDGLKTGFTGAAGYCLAYSMKTDKGNGNDSSNRLVGVSLGASSKENRKLASYNTLVYISSHYKTKYLYKKNQVIDRPALNGIPFAKVNLVSNKDLYLIQKDSEKLKKTIKYNSVDILADGDQPLANLIYTDDKGNQVASFDISTSKPLSKMNFFEKFLVSLCTIIGTIFDQVLDFSNGPRYFI